MPAFLQKPYIDIIFHICYNIDNRKNAAYARLQGENYA